jgi:hypothetical protein
MPPFCFSYFFKWDLMLFCPGWIGLWSYLCLPCSWGDRSASLCQAYWLQWGLSYFLLQLILNWNLPDLCFLGSWNYKQIPGLKYETNIFYISKIGCFEKTTQKQGAKWIESNYQN